MLKNDLEYIFDNFAERDRLCDANILVTGCSGFIGYYLMHFFARYSSNLKIKSVTGIDNFMHGKPEWIVKLSEEYKTDMHIDTFDIASENFSSHRRLEDVNFVMHMASIASPHFYRKYPLQTLDANVWGLRKLLDYYKDKKIDSFLFFSSSEVYGDPTQDFVPTPEDYRGNVFSIGPRACYDEAKRFGETLCYVYNKQHDLPCKIVRPFNNYGPGMRLDDKRVPADFANAVFNNQDIIIYSDGSPTRTYCYVTDAIIGYLKALTYEKFDVFNIGIDKPEITVLELAEIYKREGGATMDYKGDIKFDKPPEVDYLTHNPSRRCPDISKARTCLDFNPTVGIEDGVSKFLKFIKNNKGAL